MALLYTWFSLNIPVLKTGSLSLAKCSPQFSQRPSTIELTISLSLISIWMFSILKSSLQRIGLITSLTSTSRYWYDPFCLHCLFANHPAFWSFSALHIPLPVLIFMLLIFPPFFKSSQLLLSSFPTYYPFSALYSGFFQRDYVNYKLLINKPLSNRHTNICVLKEQRLLHSQEKESIHKVLGKLFTAVSLMAFSVKRLFLNPPEICLTVLVTHLTCLILLHYLWNRVKNTFIYRFVEEY